MAKIIANVFASAGSSGNLLAPPQAVVVTPEERVIGLQEVSWHDTRNDCWIVIYDRVYDITDFLDEVCTKYILLVLPGKPRLLYSLYIL